MRLFIFMLFVVILYDCQDQKKHIEPAIDKTFKVKSSTFSADSAAAMQIWDIAENEMFENKFDSGWVHINIAKKIIEKLIIQTDDSLIWAKYCDIIFSIGYNHQVQGQMDSCYPYLMKSLQMTTEHFGEDHFINTMCLNKLSNYYNYIGDMKSQREALFKSFYIRRKTLDSNDLFVAYSFMNMAYYYYLLGDLSKTNLYNSQIDNILQYHYKIYAQYKFDNTSKGILKYYSTAGWSPKTRNLFLINIPNAYLAVQFNLCNSNLMEGNEERAMFYYNRAKDFIVQNPQLPYNISSRLSYMTALKLVLAGDLIRGNIILDSMITDHKLYSIKYKSNPNNLIGLLDLKAIALEKMGKIDESFKCLNQTMDLMKNVTDHDLKVYCSYRIASIIFKMGDYNRCLTWVDSSLHILLNKNMNSPNHPDSIAWNNYPAKEVNGILYLLKLKFYAKYALAKTEKSKADLDEANRIFVELYQGILKLQEANFSDAERLNQEAEAYPLFEQAIQMSHDLYDLTLDIKYLKNILKWSETNKVNSLKKAILKQNEERRPGLQPGLAEIEEIEKVLNTTQNRIIELKREYKPSDSLQMVNLKNSLVYYNSELETLRNQNADDLSRLLRPVNSDYPITEIQDYLKNQSAALVDFFWGDSVVIINVVTQDTIHSSIIKKKLTLESELQKYLSLIRDPKSHNEAIIQKMSDSLFQELLGPVQNFIAANQLIIIPDGILNLIPFELLLKNHKEDITIRYEYSSNLLLNHHNSSLINNSYVGFAPEYSGSESISQDLADSLLLNRTYDANREFLGPLKFNTTEVKESADILGGKSFTGNNVNEDLFKEQSAKAGIIHLALHAMTDDKNPDYSQFLFKSNTGQGSIKPLYAYELNEYNLEANLAILSACNTGIGKYQRGEGILSLARSFKHAGCENIIMSLWPANDASTKDIVVGFFKHLKSGEGKASALANSKKDYLKSIPESLRHPFYWAGLVLIGDNEPMFKEFSVFPWITAIILVGFMILAYFKEARPIIQGVSV